MSAFFLLIGLVGGFTSLAIASSKGRSGAAWFALGFLFPLIAVIAIICLQPLNQQLGEEGTNQL